MNNQIREDFAEFVRDNELFNSTVLLYTSQGGTLKYEGKGVFDKKPQLVENESGQFGYQGHKSILALSMHLLTFLPSYFSLKGYFVTITDNSETKNYTITNSSYSSNVGSIYCELKEV
jgi:hypothetical protein